MADEERERRLSEALRRNLKRRKEQERERASGEQPSRAGDATDAPNGAADPGTAPEGADRGAG